MRHLTLDDIGRRITETLDRVRLAREVGDLDALDDAEADLDYAIRLWQRKRQIEQRAGVA